jgi:acyl carrier protein
VTTAEYIEPLRGYISANHLEGRAELTEETPLLEWGVIDSFALADVLAFIEHRFGVTIPTREITPDNFRDLGQLALLLIRLRSAG